jgi:glycosyltransferase involved in cell wall biosynthesis
MYEIGEELKSQIYFIVAAYNEEKVIVSVLQTIFCNGYDKVIVIDDRSKDNTHLVVRELFDKENKGILLRHEVNQGQGAALRHGIEEALKHKDCKYLVTFDSDGQHRLTDLPNFIEPLENRDCDIAIGSRFLNKETKKLVPLKKRILLKGAVFLTLLISRIDLTDTNNGYRAMNRYAAKLLPITANRYEHASILIEDIARLSEINIYREITENNDVITTTEKLLNYKEVPTYVDYSEYSKQKGQKISNALNIIFKLISYKTKMWWNK